MKNSKWARAASKPNNSQSTKPVNSKQAKKAPQLSQNQLAVILQGVTNGIVAQDTSENLVYANDAAAYILGYPSAQALLEAPLQEVMQKFEIIDELGQPFPPEQLPGRLALQGELDPGAIIRFRVLDTRKERWVAVKARPTFNKQGQVELAVTNFQDITELKQIEQHQHILAEAGRILADSVDYVTRLTNVAYIAVPYLADWCAVTIVDDELVRQLAVAHVDPAKVELAWELQQRYPPDWGASSGAANVLRTGQPELYPEITDEMLEAAARDAEHLRIVRELNIKSAMVVPLITRGRTLGVMTFIQAESGRSYSAADLELAEELGRRAALAVDNARLYAEAQRLNTELEERILERTAELEENRAMFEALFEAAPDATLLVNGTGHIVRLNRQMETMFGYNRAELLGKPVEVLLPASLRKQHIKHQAVYTVEPRLRSMGAGLELYGWRKDGSQFPVDIMLSPFYQEDKLLVIAVIRDITERKQVEAQIRESKEQLAEAQHFAQLGSWNWDITTNKLSWSDELYHIYNTSPDKFKASFEGFLKWVHDSDRNMVRRIIEEAYDNHAPFNFEHRIVRFDGAIRILQSRGKVVLDEKTGQPIRMFGTGQDITERVQAEEALRESEARFRAIFEGAAIGISLTDLERRVVESNPAFREMLGYSKEDLRQMPFSQFTHPADREANTKLYQELINGERDQFQLEKRYLHRDGQIIWSRLTVSLVRGAAGAPEFAVAIIEDIAERKQIEAELSEVQRRLMESREAERLHLAQELHDGPLQELHGMFFHLDELEPVLPNQTSLGQLVAAQAALQRVVRVLRAICVELRPPALAPFGLEKAIRSHAETFQKSYPQLKIKLDLVSDGQSLPEQVRLALFRIYQQALNNIRQHAEAQQVTIHFRLDAEQVILEVQDDGCGFKMPKRRIDLARQGHLGLIGAAERAEAINGELKIISTPGQGTLIQAIIPHVQKEDILEAE